ncbi:hypothetical protein ASG82_15485 [Mycobacterium sp. Soil538]|nr:hypothetical protein ASG82_15485 [Mycobacterium sp. Soil538]
MTSGVVELAAGALSGWVFAAVRYNDSGARRLGITSPARIRQWHLDLIALGTGTVAMGLAVPGAPVVVQRALATGAWTNAMMFLPLAYRPQLLKNPAYRALGLASFVSTSVGFAGMAVSAVRRRRAARR